MTQRHLVNGPKTPFVGNNAFINSTQNNDRSNLLRKNHDTRVFKHNVINNNNIPIVYKDVYNIYN